MNDEEIKKRRLLALASLCLVTAMACDRFSFIETKSIPYRFTFDAFGPAQRGDYVRVPAQHPLIENNRKTTLTKRIACVGGDVLTFDGEAHYCNGVAVDRINLRSTTAGEPLPIFDWNGPVPAGSLYVLGSHPRSFDSRYLGFFDAASAQKVWGLF